VLYIKYYAYILEVCKSDPNPIRSDFGTKIFISDWIGLIKLFRSRIGSDFDIRNNDELIIHDNAVVAAIFV
jgi:hypothetical protein